MKFGIVSPSFDSVSYLMDTIQSIITQAGDFSLHYHVQDASSSDGTVTMLQRLKEDLQCGIRPVQCRSFNFQLCYRAGCWRV